jgi:tetratricopeptide (TPR) repeat protein
VTGASEWDARLALLAEALERPHSATRRAELRQEITVLYREADAAAAAAVGARERAAALAVRWQALPPAEGAPGRAPVRMDHLGASTFLEKGWSRLAQGDAIGAEEALRQALAMAPGQAEGEVLLGWALALRDRLGEAQALLEGVVARHPGHALALATLGLVALRGGDLDVAEARLRAALAAGGDRKAAMYAWLHLGVVARRRGHRSEAEAAFQQALALGPNLLQGWYELGRARWEAGHALEAVGAWRSGAQASKFSPWGHRCSELLAVVEAEGTPVFSPD